MNARPPDNLGAIHAVAASALLTAVVALALSLTFRVGHGHDVLFSAHRLAERFGLLGQTLAESGTDLDGDTYASIASGGTDCYDSLQAQYSDGTASCSSSASATTFSADGLNGNTAKPGDADIPIVDHSWIKDDATGLWHVFFQNDNATYTTEAIEHFTSTNLTGDLAYNDTELAPGTNTWDEQLWAPQVFKEGSTYYMFYTGVTNDGNAAQDYQRIGLATATSLNGPWTRVTSSSSCDSVTGNGCVYNCNESWTYWSRGQDYDRSCRDPFVIRDTANSRWLLFAMARLSQGGASLSDGVVVASSTNLTTWTGLGYVKATRRVRTWEGGTASQDWGGIAENPFVASFNGTYYLFFTDWHDEEAGFSDCQGGSPTCTMVQYATTTNLTADSSGSTNWAYRGYHQVRGVNATEVVPYSGDTWIASSSMTNGNVGSQFVYADLIWRRILWNSDGTYTVSKLTKPTCRVASNTIKPGGAEICSDNVDQNCSGTADEALYCAACADADGDGYGVSGLNNCSKTGVDSNDADAAIYPGAAEICDAKDNDSDGSTDEGGVCPCVESWACGLWSSCTAARETRVCQDANACGTTSNKPETSRTCTEPTPSVCDEQWTCGEWGACRDGFQVRSCTDATACGTETEKPATLKSCVVAENPLIAVPLSPRTPVVFYDASGRRTKSVRPFSATVGAAAVAAGDVDRDGDIDLVAGSGRGGPPRVRVFDANGTRWQEFAPYVDSVRSGVYLAVGDVDGDSQRDIVTVPDGGDIGRVRTYTYNAARRRFVARTTFTPRAFWRRGWHFLLDDVDGNGAADLVLAPRNRRNPRVEIYRFDATRQRWARVRSFVVPAETGQESFATADLDGDGQRELLIGSGPGIRPVVRVYRSSGTRRFTQRLGSTRDRRGLRLTGYDIDSDGRDELLVGSVSGSNRVIRVYELQAPRRFRRETNLTLDQPAGAIRTFVSPR